MSKIKVSFSLFFAIFLVGILSTAAFAHSAWNLSVSPDGTGGFNFGFDKTFQSGDTTTAFHLDVYSVDPATQALGGTPVFTKDFTYSDTDATSHSVDVTKALGNIQVGTLYDFVLTSGGQVVGEKFGVLTNGHNYRLAYTAVPGDKITYNNPDGTAVTLDIKGSGLANSNHTGADSKKKSGQKTHGFYQNNTNSCAVCHQTHTSDDNGAGSGSSNLLMKDGVYSTCSACHDGTTGAYNAFEKADAEVAKSIVGTFNVTMDGQTGTHNGSLHDADGSLKLTAAPGGNITAGSKFDSSFDCASCHNPHGGGSLNENNLNQDPLGWGTVVYNGTPGTVLPNVFGKSVTTTKDNEYGKLYQNPTIYTQDQVDAANAVKDSKGKPAPVQLSSAPYIFVMNTAGVDLSALDQTNATQKTEYYYLNRDGYVSGKPILMTYRWQKGGYVPDFSLWLQEKSYPFKADTALYSDDWANLSLTSANNYNDTAKDITRATGDTTAVNVVWKDGFAWGPGVANVKSIQVSLGVDVETTSDIKTLYDEELPTYIPDSGVEMSKYCASCHTDYLSTTRNVSTGVYTQAHRHMTLADETNCIRCHFGHGTDATIMGDANDINFQSNPEKTLDYFKDVNASSALKRYTGMTVCYACHGQGEQFLGNPNNETDPTTHLSTGVLEFGQPGTRGVYAE
jgi:hypothetical protein